MARMRRSRRGWRLAMGACALLAGAAASPDSFAASAPDKAAVFSIEFAGQSAGSAYEWLKDKGFELKEDADDEKKSP